MINKKADIIKTLITIPLNTINRFKSTFSYESKFFSNNI